MNNDDFMRFMASWALVHETADEGWKAAVTRGEGQQTGTMEAGPEAFVDGLSAMIAERKEQENALRRSNRELEQFAYVASHDLQEPLRMVSSYLDLLVRRANDRLDERARGYVDFATITGWVASAGYRGDIEVEIFNQQVWSTPGDLTLAKMAQRYREHVLPYL